MTTSDSPDYSAGRHSALFVTTFAVLSLALVHSAHAQILSNGTGGGDWDATGTWQDGSVPGYSDSFTVLSGDTVDSPDGHYYPLGGSTVTIDGTLDYGSQYIDFRNSTWLVTGTLTMLRFLANHGGTDPVIDLHIDGGTVDYSSRALLTAGNTANTKANKITLSNNGTFGGSVDTSYLNMWGPDLAATATNPVLTINGPGTFEVTTITLADTGASTPSNTATDIRFNFGTAAGAGALASMTSTSSFGTSLTFADNPLTIDFTNIDRGAYNGNFTTTLFDYPSGGTLSGSFATPTFIGLNAALGETASITHNVGETRFDLEYTLVSPAKGTVILIR